MKVIITIIVVAVIGFIVGYLLMNGAKIHQYSYEDTSSGENMELNISGEDFGKIIVNLSGDDNDIEESGEILSQFSKEEKIRMINEKVNEINSGDVQVKSYAEKLTLDLVNDSAKEFMKYFKVDEISVTINVKQGRVEIIPDTDFIENMVYYYDENSDLILYENVSTTVEGSCKYYFEKGKGIAVIPDYEEKIEVKEEYVGDVLNRSKLIYDKYGN